MPAAEACPHRAVEVVEAWVRGERTLAEVRVAAIGAFEVWASTQGDAAEAALVVATVALAVWKDVNDPALKGGACA